MFQCPVQRLQWLLLGHCAFVPNDQFVYLLNLRHCAVLAMLQVGLKLICIFIGNFTAECAVRPPSNKVPAIPDETNARTTSFWQGILAKSDETKNVFPVPPGA